MSPKMIETILIRLIMLLIVIFVGFPLLMVVTIEVLITSRDEQVTAWLGIFDILIQKGFLK